MKRNIWILILLCLFSAQFSKAQSDTLKNSELDNALQSILREDGVKSPHGYIVPGEIVDNDTLYYVYLRQIIILPPREFKNKREYRRYSRLVRYVKKVYPYSQIIKNTLYEINENVQHIDSKREKKHYIDSMENELKKEFEGQLRKLTFTQGLILIKLVDRETGQTSYQIIKELKGSLTAFFWQSVARLFHSNLKAEYDPEGDERLIEEIVIRIENGQL